MQVFVIPAFNEEENLPLLHAAIAAVCDPGNIDFELLLVDDGSRDGSWAAIEKLAATTTHPSKQALNIMLSFTK